MDKNSVMDRAETPGRSACTDGYSRSSERKWWRLGLFLVFLGLLSGVFAMSLIPEKTVEPEGCLGIPVLSEEAYSRFTTYDKTYYGEYIRFQNELVALDEENSVIYITQQIDASTSIQDLKGSLSIDLPGKKMYFAPDSAWDDLMGAVSSGHKFKLLIPGSRDTYMQYDVVFTTLPVISMHGTLLYKMEEYKDVYSGRMSLWDPEELGAGKEGVLTSRLHWHARGRYSLYEPKNSWKVSLKDWDWDNSNEDLLGLGSDDDWILNAMNLEDSNIRDKLGMDLWNEMAAETDYNRSMSRGEYVEVLIDGEYMGLYLLQRRIDDKYLELEEDTVLVKATPDKGVIEYEFFSSVDETLPEEELQRYFEQEVSNNVECRNFVDVSLYLQLFSAMDNRIQKNMYYAFTGTEAGYTVSLIPWDLDMTMGVSWSDEQNRYIYDYEDSLNKNIIRMEMESMQQQYPDLDERLRQRWQQLRQSFFSQEYIESLIARNLDILDRSGAVSRDQQTWGLYFEGDDTIERLYRFLEERLSFLDAYYSE